MQSSPTHTFLKTFWWKSARKEIAPPLESSFSFSTGTFFEQLWHHRRKLETLLIQSTVGKRAKRTPCTTGETTVKQQWSSLQDKTFSSSQTFSSSHLSKVAQMAARLTRDLKVPSSNPTGSYETDSVLHRLMMITIHGIMGIPRAVELLFWAFGPWLL